jgi:alpha-beta hydrolase superfamily lysophospholipase
LGNPAAHGIRIQPYACARGAAPCLMVSADAKSGPGQRGQLLRQQLVTAGTKLAPYGHKARGILVLLHGRKGRKEDLLPVAERFAAAGFHCVIPDLPAHGESPIETSGFSTGTFESRLAALVLEDARTFFADAESPAGLWGMSMGGAYATQSAAIAGDLWKAMVIVASFDTLDGVVADRAKSSLGFLNRPFATLLDGFVAMRGGVPISSVRPAQWAQQVSIPVLVAHGDQDSIIPIHRGQRLFAAYQASSKQWIPVPGGTHSTILITPLPLYSMMSQWYIKHME